MHLYFACDGDFLQFDIVYSHHNYLFIMIEIAQWVLHRCSLYSFAPSEFCLNIICLCAYVHLYIYMCLHLCYGQAILLYIYITLTFYEKKGGY